MKMSPIKKIVVVLAAVTVALSLITANNMASVMLIVASRQAGASNQQTVQTNTGVQGQTGNSSQGNTISDNTGSDNTATDNTGSGSTVSGGDSNTNTNSGSAGATPGSSSTDKPAAVNGSTATKPGKMPQGTAEIVNYFNTASNNVKSKAKSVTKVKEENYQAQPIDLGSLGAFSGTISKLVDDNMGVNEEQSGRVESTPAGISAMYPVEGESWSSKLTVDDVKTATCTEKNGVYTITITLKNDELAEEYAHGTGHHGKAFSIVMPSTIKDNAGPAKSLLKSLKVGYQDGKIVVDVDAATGNIISAKYDYIWLLNVDMFGGITAYFGIKTDFTVKW